MSSAPVEPTPTAAPLLTPRYLLLVLATFFFFLALATFFLLPRQLVGFDASSTEVGWVMGSFQLATLVTMPLVGMMLHRINPRGLMLRGAVLFAATCVGLSYAEGLGWLFYAARVTQGVAFSLFFVSAGSLVVAVIPDSRRAQGIALWGVAALVSQAVAPLVGEAVLARWTFAELYLGAAACCGVAAMSSLLVTAPAPPSEPPSPLLRLLRRRSILAGLAALAATALGLGTILSFLSAFTEREGLGAVSPFFGGYTGASVAVRLLGGRLADRYDRRLVIIPSAVVGSGALGFLCLAQNGWHLAIIGIAYGVGSGLAYPTLMAYVVDQADPADRPRAVALDNWAFTVGMLLAAVVFGPVADAVGMRGAFVVMAAAGTLAALPLLAIRPSKLGPTPAELAGGGPPAT